MWVQMKALEEGGTGSSSKGGFKLQDIELSLRSGELLGVVGNVGSGTEKTIRMRALSFSFQEFPAFRTNGVQPASFLARQVCCMLCWGR